VSTAVRSAVSRSAHHDVMVRLRSTHSDRVTSVPKPIPAGMYLATRAAAVKATPDPALRCDGRRASTVIVQEETPVTEPFTTTTNDQLLVTPEEAARRLSIGRTTIYELMSSGELKSVNIGRSRRVPVSSLSSFVSRLIGDVVVER